MRTNWFIVIAAKGAWWVDNEGTSFGPFSTRELACLEAMTIARRFGDAARRSCIYWPDDTGRQRLMWEAD